MNPRLLTRVSTTFFLFFFFCSSTSALSQAKVVGVVTVVTAITVVTVVTSLDSRAWGPSSPLFIFSWLDPPNSETRNICCVYLATQGMLRKGRSERGWPHGCVPACLRAPRGTDRARPSLVNCQLWTHAFRTSYNLDFSTFFIVLAD